MASGEAKRIPLEYSRLLHERELRKTINAGSWLRDKEEMCGCYSGEKSRIHGCGL